MQDDCKAPPKGPILIEFRPLPLPRKAPIEIAFTLFATALRPQDIELLPLALAVPIAVAKSPLAFAAAPIAILLSPVDDVDEEPIAT
jgi:hypothetical protein